MFTVKRNQRGDDKMYVGPENKGYKLVHGLYKNKTEKTMEIAISIDGVQGMILIADESVAIGKYVPPISHSQHLNRPLPTQTD